MKKNNILIKHKNIEINHKSTKDLHQKKQLNISYTEELNLKKSHKNSVSVQKNQHILSKNDLKLPIFVDSTGFIIEYSNLIHCLKCQCYLSQDLTKTNFKINSSSNLLLTAKKQKKKQFLEINLTQTHISLIKDSVQHKFHLDPEPKHDYLKVIIGQNWQLEQFHTPNKKIKTIDKVAMKYDQIYPLKRIQQAGTMRMFKLKKTQSKINISWLNQVKQTQEQDKNTKILSFSLNNSIKKQQPLKKSFNQHDQTKDSEDQDILEFNKSTYSHNYQRKEKFI